MGSHATSLARAANLFKTGSGRPLAAACMVLEGAEGLDDLLDMVYLPQSVPGYAWIFPPADSLVNVGFGLTSLEGVAVNGRDLTHILDRLLKQAPFVAQKLVHAKPVSKPRHGVLRACFGDAHTCDAGLLVVGEAAGLVDPLSGQCLLCPRNIVP